MYKEFKKRGISQKLAHCTRNNVIVHDMLNAHKGKLNAKFFIRCIYLLCKENKQLVNDYVKLYESNTKHYKGEANE